jgi:hypothetical protein
MAVRNHLSVVDDCFNDDFGVSLCVPEDIPPEDAHRLVLRYASRSCGATCATIVRPRARSAGPFPG